MTDTPLVSVVIATFNMAQYLPNAVQSVLCQSMSDLEVHIVDDGSTDNTHEVVRSFSDARILYHRQHNGGQAKAKNNGIQASRGRFIAFLDADDAWMPHKLATQLPLFEASPAVGVVYSPAIYIDATGKEIPPFLPTRHRGRVAGPLLIENFVTFPSTVVRRECFSTAGLFDEAIPMAIDYDLWLRISVQHEFDYVDEPLLYYRVWPGQISTRNYERYEYAIAIMRRFLEANPGLVSPGIIREAWAHTYCGRANHSTSVRRATVAALRDYSRSLSFVPTYLPAWKGIVKALLRVA
jgi:glycosyltransferase involved in cell wall biosynthesis